MWRALMSSRFASWVVGKVSLPKERQVQHELDLQRLYILTQLARAGAAGRQANMQALMLKVSRVRRASGLYGSVGVSGPCRSRICFEPSVAQHPSLSARLPTFMLIPSHSTACCPAPSLSFSAYLWSSRPRFLFSLSVPTRRPDLTHLSCTFPRRSFTHFARTSCTRLTVEPVLGAVGHPGRGGGGADGPGARAG